MAMPELLRDIADKYETLETSKQSPAFKELLHATGDELRADLVGWQVLLSLCVQLENERG